MQVISEGFTDEERQRRLQVLGNPQVEEIKCCNPPIYVVRRGDRKLGVGLTIDVAIADAEHNLESWIA